MIEPLSTIVEIIIYAVVIITTSNFMLKKATKALSSEITGLNKLVLKNKEDINNLKAINKIDQINKHYNEKMDKILKDTSKCNTSRDNYHERKK